MAFTEFYCNAATGSNLNGGSSEGAPVTYASGNWVAGTGVFTVASGDPTSDVNVGDFASVYADGATATGFVGRVTARDATTITVSLTAASGTPPADGTGNRTVKVGGPWKGPNAAESFPFSFVASAMNDGTNLIPRVNLKNNQSYAATGALTNSSVQVWWQGYTSTVGDGGKATIDGGESGSAYNLFLSSGNNNTYLDLIWAHNGLTGGGASTHGVNVTGARSLFLRCVAWGMRCSGFNCTSVVSWFVECESYDCNRSNNSTSRAGIHVGATGCAVIRCYSHHHTGGSNANGFYIDQSVLFFGCVSHSNTGAGIYSQGDQMLAMLNCDSYNNGSHGLHLTAATGILQLGIQNCNFVKNTGFGIFSANAQRFGVIYNCGFGSGTQANTSGQMTANLVPVLVVGTVTYASDVTPWADPANGDFRITLAAAKDTGRGAYTQTYTSESARNTVSYPDIGAAQHQDSGGGTRVY
jgi:hypothetical protein